MGLFHKAKRVVKLGVACVATYYVAKACNDVAYAEHQEDYKRPAIEETYIQRDTIGDDTYKPRIDVREVGGEALR
ncbi:MAG: hypothetical protein ACLFO2_04860 [Candidatus Woesearchaeota archaeon]